MRFFSTFLFLGIAIFGCDSTSAQGHHVSWNQTAAFEFGQDRMLPAAHHLTSPSGEAEFEIEFEDPFDEPIETDRHDFTQSPKVVGRGVRQLEFGVLYSTLSDGEERETTYATPELLLRLGLSERMEFRTRFKYGWKYNNEGEDIQGTQDLIFGIKYQLSEQSGRRPDSAIELRLSAPTGADALSTGRWEPGVDFIYGWEFHEHFSFTGSTGGNANALGDISFLTAETDPTDQFVAWTQSFALGAKLTEKTTGYFEWFGIFTHAREDDNGLSFLNLGIDYLINDNLVVDFRIGWGLTSASDDLFAGIGGAIRF